MAEERKKTEPKTANDPEQSKRFEKTAQLLEADQSGKLFERVLQTVVKPKPVSGD